jgi:hypothetical protein
MIHPSGLICSKLKKSICKVEVLKLRMGIRLDFGLIHGFMTNLYALFLPFSLCHQKEVFVADVMSGSVQITFRRWLTPELHSCWNVIQSDMHKF